MEKYTRKEYAKYLQAKFESYFTDFSNQVGKPIEQIIIDYCGPNSDIEDIYSIDTILNFLADYGSYYLHELELIETSEDYEQMERIKSKIEEIDKEYDILERLIYNTGQAFILEKEEGKIKEITKEEKEDTFTGEKICSDTEMKEISNWLRYSYYIFISNYRNKVTSMKVGKEEYNFEMTEDNICHLLGIKKSREVSSFLRDNKINIFELLKMIMNEGNIINGETSLERITKYQKDTPLFNYQMIKYKNYLFQNFGILSNSSAIWINARPKPQNDWGSDTFLLSKLNKKCGKDNYSRFGFFNKENKTRTYLPETLQTENALTNGTGEVYNIKAVFEKTKGKVKNVKERKTNTSKKELCCIFSAKEQLRMIESILEEGAETLTKHNVTELKIYYYKIYSAIEKFTKTKDILKEKNLENTNTKRK